MVHSAVLFIVGMSGENKEKEERNHGGISNYTWAACSKQRKGIEEDMAMSRQVKCVGRCEVSVKSRL